MVADDPTNGLSHPGSLARIRGELEHLDVLRELGTLFSRELGNERDDPLDTGGSGSHTASMGQGAPGVDPQPSPA